MVAQLLAQSESLQFPIQIKKMTDKETNEYHIKKLYEVSIKSLGEIPLLEEPTFEQKVWMAHKMIAPSWTWQRWFVGLHFAEDQKREMELTDKDIAGKGMK